MKEARKILRFSEWVTAHPWWVLLSVLLVVTAMGVGIKNLSFKNDYKVYFSKENPELLAFENIQKTYSKSDSVLFVVAPKDENVFKPSTLQAIQELTTKAWQIPFSSRVDSITNFQHTEADGDDLIVADLVINPRPSVEIMHKIRHIALSEPLLVNRLISKQGHVAGVNVVLQLPNKDPMEAAEVAEKARVLVAEIEKKIP